MRKNHFLLFCLLVISFFASSKLSAQCYDSQHDNATSSSWLSCTTSPNPNAARGNGHWIHYDFGDVYNLADTHVWNYNKSGQTNRGLQTVIIDYSLEGVNWNTLGSFSWTQATGFPNYAGFAGPNFNGINARHVVITVVNGFSISSCYGFSEIRFNVNDNTECADFDAVAKATPPCTNANDGWATLAVDGGQTPFSFAWSAGSSNDTQYNLSAGTYTVTITDTNNCQESVVVLVENDTTVPNSIDDVPVPDNTYYNTLITSGGVVGYNSNVDYRAQDCIQLNGGFQVVQGGEFLAEIKNCGVPAALAEEAEKARGEK